MLPITSSLSPSFTGMVPENNNSSSFTSIVKGFFEEIAGRFRNISRSLFSRNVYRVITIDQMDNWTLRIELKRAAIKNQQRFLLEYVNHPKMTLEGLVNVLSELADWNHESTLRKILDLPHVKGQFFPIFKKAFSAFDSNLTKCLLGKPDFNFSTHQKYELVRSAAYAFREVGHLYKEVEAFEKNIISTVMNISDSDSESAFLINEFLLYRVHIEGLSLRPFNNLDDINLQNYPITARIIEGFKSKYQFI